jgi:two-component SAPR family response regulator
MTAASLSGITVLIVEDNFVVADSLRYLIESNAGAVTAIVPTLERAFAALAAVTVDVAILDINLRGESVVPFAEHLRESGVPFLFLSGYRDEGMLPPDLRSHPRFDKPVEPESLFRTLRELANRPASPRIAHPGDADAE